MESQPGTAVPFALLDLDDTLLDQARALRSWAAGFAAEAGLDAAEADWIAATGVATPGWRAFAAKIHERYEYARDVDRLVAAITVEYPRHFVLDPAVAAGLAALRGRGWRLGVVTNGATLMQNAKIEQVGLRAHVDAVCVSQEEGVEKPDRRIFEIAMAKLGVGADAAGSFAHGWMVGDNLAADIAGGRGCGLRTVWLPLGRPLDPDGPRPDYTAASMADALALLGELG
jgi:FMN phosphatase YigB (HAD superfamily)